MPSRVLMIAGFGDNASMYEPQLSTSIGGSHELLALNLPGFGAPALDGQTTLQTLAEFVKATAIETGADTIIAHSVASIVASLAARSEGSPLTQIISLEGNLTAADAYFSGRAADFEDPASFRDWFLPRIAAKGADDPILARYASEVTKADPEALWQLGCDARRFSEDHHPGEVLKDSGEVLYVYNPENCADISLRWLKESGLNAVLLEGASHWPTLDRPAKLAEAIDKAMA